MQLDAEALCAALAQRIGTLPADTALVGIHSGGAWVAQRLHAALRPATPLGTLAVTLHRDDFGRIGLHPQKKTTDMPFEVDGRPIVLVDDVLHTGRTLRAALNELFDFGRPASVKLAVLVDRGQRELPFAADHAATTMNLGPGEHLVLKEVDGRLVFDLTAKP
jgi:pyrimidine operon attenuation protein/uracil phosphoribosyltransferase